MERIRKPDSLMRMELTVRFSVILDLAGYRQAASSCLVGSHVVKAGTQVAGVHAEDAADDEADVVYAFNQTERNI